jgi:hypothetical protein
MRATALSFLPTQVCKTDCDRPASWGSKSSTFLREKLFIWRGQFFGRRRAKGIALIFFINGLTVTAALKDTVHRLI